MPLCFLQAQLLSHLLLVTQEANHRAIVKFHDVVAHFGTYRIRLCLEVVYLCDAEFNFVECFAQLVLAFSLLGVEDAVDLGLHLLRLLDQRAKELISLLQFNLGLILVLSEFFLCLGIALVALLHIFIGPPEPFFVLVHAELQRLF